jgi:tetratricopeptide (TPR) repeat protein
MVSSRRPIAPASGRGQSKDDGPRASALLKQAASLRQAGRFADAVAVMQQAIAANPIDAQAHYGLGLTLARCHREADAVQSFERAVRLKPDFAEAYHALGVALQNLGRVEPAVAMLRRAVELAPRLADAHARLGDLLHAAQDLSASQAAYRRAAAAARSTIFGRICEAKFLVGEQRFAEAGEIMRRALALDPGNVEAMNTAGRILSYMGALDDAAAHYERALELAGDDPWVAWCGLARSRKLTASDRPLMARIDSLLARGQLPADTRMRVRFALGKACDDCADYEAAMRHFDEANRIRRALQPFDRDQFIRAVESVVSCFTPQFFAERQGVGVMDETPLFVLGMPRSGTTLVEQLISSHPQAAAAGELEFWGQRAAALDQAAVEKMAAEQARLIAADYLAVLCRATPDAARIVDKMPFNFNWIGLIRLIFPRAGIIHCRRHPIDTCLSIYVTDFESNWGFISDRDDLVFFYRQYRRLMAHWRSVLPQPQFIDVDYELVAGDPEAETRRLIAFCGLPWDDACLHPERNRRAVQTASLWQARQPVYRSSVERWRKYERWLGALAELHEADGAS